MALDGNDRPADILVVDDDPKNLIAIEVALGELGGHLVKTRSGAEALRRLLEQDFALILLDVQMPSMNGFETARIIRNRARTRHVPIIFVTAFSQNDEDIRRGYSLGAVDYLFKPIVPEVLRAKAQVFVELRERTAEVERQSRRVRALERAAADRRLEEERRRWEAEAMRRHMLELQDADRRKDEFIAMLAHELRNPLSPIVTSLELLKTRVSDPLAARARDVMERQARHLVRLIDDLLDVARVTQGKIELHREIVELGHVVQQAIETCRPAIEERHHALVVHDGPGVIHVDADPVRLTQVIANLLNNAVRYTDPGGRIEIAWEQTGDTASVHVVDNGRGIAPDLIDRIFEMFVQERTGGKGLGLGLTLVKRLVAMHGGDVSVASDGPGMGSTFTVRLPVRDGVEDRARSESDESVASSRLRVALVEDDEDVRELVATLLGQWGHEVRGASTADEGETLVREWIPDVALIDIGLPDRSGHELAHGLCEAMGARRPRLVAVTGYGQAHDRKRALEVGFDEHITKPADARTLARVLHRR